MIGHFLVVTMSSITLQSLRKIVQRATAVGAKIWCLTLCFYWQDAAKRQTAGIKFTHRPKMSIFTPQGQLFSPIRVKLGMADGHMSPLGCAKFHLSIGAWGWESGPQNIKDFHS